MMMMRLARDQGALQGRDVGPVQTLTLVMLDREEQYQSVVREATGEALALKTALLSHNPANGKSLFPEYFGTGDVDERIEQDEVDPETSEDIERWINEAKSGSVTGAELLQGPDDGWS